VGKTETISSKIRKETRVSTLSTLIQYSAEIPSHSNKARERNKRDLDWEEIKLFLLTDDVILYLKYPNDSIKNHSDPINSFAM
jgi:hypothetical protein